MAQTAQATSQSATQHYTALHASSKTVRQFSDIKRGPAQHTQHHKTASSKTLMRHAVTKPKPSLKRHTKVQQRTDILVKQPSIVVQPKVHAYQVDGTKVSRAHQTPRHKEVDRYAAPRPKPTPTSVSAPTVAAPAIVAATAQAAAVNTSAKEASKSMDIFEQALARANGHIEKPSSRKHARHRHALFGSRSLSIGATSLAVLLLVGFFAWQQKASITMRYAAAKSGVASSLPSYTPEGYTVGKFNYSSGLVGVNFHNSQTNKNFAIVQQASSWDSQALLDSYVANQGRTYQTIDAAGRTLYTYGSNNATWVDNGVWYQVKSDGNLSTNELINIALSM